MKKFAVALCLIFLFSSPGAAEDARVINIVSPVWPGSLNKDGTGIYLDFFRDIYEPIGIKVVHTEMPFKRALDMVEKGRADVALDLFEKVLPTVHFPKYPMSAIVGTVVFLKGKFKWEGEKTLLNQKVVWIRGYDIHKLVKTRMIWFEVNGIDQGISMIEKGREDFYIDESRAIQNYFESHKDQVEKFQREELYTIHLFPGFSKTERAAKYMQLYEKRVIEILKNGSMEKTFAKADRIEMFRVLKKEIERRIRAKV